MIRLINPKNAAGLNSSSRGRTHYEVNPLTGTEVQTIGMGDAAVTLTRATGAPTGTSLTDNPDGLLLGNLLYVDAESSGSENLLLPYEADCKHLMLWVVNTGGETINVQTDAGGAIASIATGNTGEFFCDGTTWYGVESSELTSFTDDVTLDLGTGGPVTMSWDTTDANANELLLQLPPGGATDVPAWIIGQSIESVDFGLYNGLVDPLIMILGVGAVTSAATWEFRKTRGTAGSPTVITTGDALGTIDAYGYSGAGGYVHSCAIEFLSEATVATTRVPGRILFRTGTDAAPSVLTTALEIGSDQICTFAAKITAELGIFDADMIIDSTNAIEIQIGAVGLIQLDDDNIASFAAATDTVGQGCYIETQDAGGTATAARVGGLLNIRTGEGSGGASAVIAGAGGSMTLQAGSGGDQTGTASGGASGAVVLESAIAGLNSGAGASGTGGASGTMTVRTGAGGTTNNTGTDNGGNSGALALSTGTGGSATGAGDSDGGTAGDITLTPGSGGTSSNGAAGAPGDVVTAGLLRQGVQTIDMANATVTLTLVPAAPAGTLMTGNVLYVDANGGANNLLMPPEADLTGGIIMVVNTGGETITIQNDGAGAVLVLETANTAMLTCDGTTLRGLVGVP